jgi:hypothetical protein
MARKIELRSGVLRPINGSRPEPFTWSDVLQQVLTRAPPGGLSLELVFRSVEAMRPIAQAVEDKAESVILTEEQWHTLCARLEQYPFGVADEAIVEFGLAIREAREIT